MDKPEIILALDLPSKEEALQFIRPLRGQLKWVKVGLQMFTRYGSDWVRELGDEGLSIFLDLKLHDIPNTVGRAIESLRDLPVGMLTVHTSGGRAMMETAVSAANSWTSPPALLGVTVLTSLDATDCISIGWSAGPQRQVERLAGLAFQGGLAGIICSPLELASLRGMLPDAFLRVVPGIRPPAFGKDEQKRTLTPAEAVRAGAHGLVIGRPLLRAEDPLALFLSIQEEIGAVQP